MMLVVVLATRSAFSREGKYCQEKAFPLAPHWAAELEQLWVASWVVEKADAWDTPSGSEWVSWMGGPKAALRERH
jgi:hypothetical protein